MQTQIHENLSKITGEKVDEGSPLTDAVKSAQEGIERGVAKSLALIAQTSERYGKSNTDKVVLTLASGCASAKDFRAMLTRKLGKASLDS